MIELPANLVIDQVDRSVFLRGFWKLLMRLNGNTWTPQESYISLPVGGDREPDLQQTIKCAKS